MRCVDVFRACAKFIVRETRKAHVCRGVEGASAPARVSLRLRASAGTGEMCQKTNGELVNGILYVCISLSSSS